MVKLFDNFHLSYIVIIGLVLISLCFVWINKLNKKNIVLHSFDASDTLPIRGIMALLIVMAHVSFEFDESHFGWPFTSFGAPIVSVFFFLSGYGLTVSFEKKGLCYLTDWGRKTFRKIVIPFLFACTIWILISGIFLNRDMVNMMSGFILFNPPLPYSWFVYALLLFYCSFYFVNKLTSNIYLKQLLLLIITFAFIVFFRVLDFAVYWYISLLAFNVGAIYGEWHDLANDVLRRYPVCVLSSLMAIIVVMSALGLRSTLLAIIPLGVVVPILVLGSGKQFGWLTYLGSISYEIYLAHGIIIPLLGHANLGWFSYLILAECMSIMLAIILKKTNRFLFAVR